MMKNFEIAPSIASEQGNAREDLFKRLQSVMKMQCQIFKGLSSLAKSKEKALVEANIQEIKKLTEAENMLITQSGQVESLRQKVTEELLLHLGASTEQQQTVSEMLPYLPEPWRPQLLELVEDLQNSIDLLCKQNETNSQLIHQSLEFCQHFHELLRDVGDEEFTYSPHQSPRNAPVESSRRANIFNKKI
ncbi:flagellar protein FlgN [Heliorestis convoluta]|uniref:Putative flagellar protein FlgN n=1 Tax=Heliorestis convoluta TaxID=356322 RepID=A0A5Q2MZL9_9FIRM|nr:flagellar protein FlgN [Heliorestis convoluta]QGG47481.1 putative flagellar protein FlgN [Heliorestis convoluta]